MRLLTDITAFARRSRSARWALRLFFAYAAWKAFFLLSLVLVPLPTSFLERDFSVAHLNSRNELLRLTLSPQHQYRVKLPLEKIGPELKSGFLAYEDKHFYWHPGVNPVAVARSVVANIRSGRVVMGGSTITMQIAKIMEPKRRTLAAKVIEVFRAFQLETRYSKDELLAIYLNSVPMGGNIQGVGAASYLYFGKSADRLSPSESAMLIAIPKSPNHFRPDRNGERAQVQKTRVLERIGSAIGASNRDYENIRRGVPVQRRSNPFTYPHLVVRAQSMGTDAVRRYTIDPYLQATASDLLAAALTRLSPLGVHNGAVMVIDNHTMRVLAYVGSPDFNDTRHEGQINGANIPRSPGSLLKPFLYALAIEGGDITPRTTLFDIERNYDGYVPANFDRTFRGPVPAQDALVGSLNVPAVNLEFELGERGLGSFLRTTRLEQAGRSARQAGLSLVLGAYPLTLEELVRLYSIFPNGGRLRNLQFFDDENSGVNEGIPVFSPGTSYMIAEMLTKMERPDLPQSWEFTSSRGRIAFKTGTSFGLRDAWCIGFNPDFTVGVWLGNANAKGSTALVGIKAAAPVVVSVFNHMTRFKDSWFQRPPSVVTREVCAISGEPASPACPVRVTDVALVGVSRTEPCSIHRFITVDRAKGWEVCSACMTGPRSRYEQRVIEMWPPDVATFLRSSGKAVAPLPKHNPACTAVTAGHALKLRSPLPGGFYKVTPTLDPAQQKIALTVQSQRGDTRVYWYVDDRLIAQGPPDRTFFLDPIPGRHRISVRDAWGGFDSSSFIVRRGL